MIQLLPDDVLRNSLLEVTDVELETTKKAFDWFVTSRALCVGYAQESLLIRMNTDLTSEEMKFTDKMISDLEKQLSMLGK